MPHVWLMANVSLFLADSLIACDSRVAGREVGNR